MGATHAEKSTVDAGALNAVPTASGGAGTASFVASAAADEPATDVKFCSIDNPDCEACQ
jgi:ribonucleoside-diphosphate reductase alpha chain